MIGLNRKADASLEIRIGASTLYSRCTPLQKTSLMWKVSTLTKQSHAMNEFVTLASDPADVAFVSWFQKLPEVGCVVYRLKRLFHSYFLLERNVTILFGCLSGRLVYGLSSLTLTLCSPLNYDITCVFPPSPRKTTPFTVLTPSTLPAMFTAPTQSSNTWGAKTPYYPMSTCRLL